MKLADWLSHTVAGAVMVRDVITLNPADTLAHAAGVLLDNQMSGAPVVDSDHVCVGVVSAADLLGAEEKVAAARRQEAESSIWHSQLALPASVYESRLAAIRDELAPAAEQPVERFMTRDIVSVESGTPVGKVIRNMVNAHIHRVVVLDADRHLLGIITTTDLLAALLRAGK
jgi:CBS-domain-containing membrane protein